MHSILSNMSSNDTIHNRLKIKKNNQCVAMHVPGNIDVNVFLFIWEKSCLLQY